MNSPLIDRRSFLSLATAGLPGPTGSRSRGGAAEDDPWWLECETSALYRLFAEAAQADGLILECGASLGHQVTFLDEAFALAKPIVLPPAEAKREIQVVGDVPYEMSLVGPNAEGVTQIAVSFQSTTRVRLFIDSSKHGGIIAVLHDTQRRGSA